MKLKGKMTILKLSKVKCIRRALKIVLNEDNRRWINAMKIAAIKIEQRINYWNNHRSIDIRNYYRSAKVSIL